MPTIPLEVLDCTVYLYESEEATEEGERAGGSGFLVAVPLPGYDVGTFYCVTNAHVVGKGFRWIRLNTADGSHEAVERTDAEWVRHRDGDDLAVAELTLSTDFRYKAISVDLFVKGDDVSLFGSQLPQMMLSSPCGTRSCRPACQRI